MHDSEPVLLLVGRLAARTSGDAPRRPLWPLVRRAGRDEARRALEAIAATVADAGGVDKDALLHITSAGGEAALVRVVARVVRRR